jgi:hypothetical protein
MQAIPQDWRSRSLYIMCRDSEFVIRLFARRPLQGTHILFHWRTRARPAGAAGSIWQAGCDYNNKEKKEAARNPAIKTFYAWAFRCWSM